MLIQPGLRTFTVRVPPSKSQVHRLMIAEYLATGECNLPGLGSEELCDDLKATERCLKGSFDCGESGTTLRLLAPVFAALERRGEWKMCGRLAARPRLEYRTLEAGVHEIPGDISSQFASGLLFALPLLKGDSEIHFSSAPVSRGYIDMTLQVLAAYGIEIEKTPRGFFVKGSQSYRSPRQRVAIEGDWSAAAFWYVARALGNKVEIENEDSLKSDSHQPDRAIVNLIGAREIDIDETPDLFPPLVIAAAALEGETLFRRIARLRFKESDRVQAMASMLGTLGVDCEIQGDGFVVNSRGEKFRGGEINSCGDHRIAMSAAIAATYATAPIEILSAECVRKSYPSFSADFAQLQGDEGFGMMSAL